MLDIVFNMKGVSIQYVISFYTFNFLYVLFLFVM